jgi:2-iminobutanoate/2-iminopropanoate deaminase
MKRRAIHTDTAPKTVGPYSQAVWSGDLLFCAGQVPLDPQTGELVDGGIADQTTRVMENINAVLRSQELSFGNVIKTTVYMVDLAEFSAMNEVYGKYFPTDPPARSTVQVAALPKGAQVEIEVVAAR